MKRHIGFRLQQTRARGGASRCDVATIQQHDIDARLGEMKRGERTADASTNHRDLTRHVGVERGVACEQAVFQRPEWTAGNQVHGRMTVPTFPSKFREEEVFATQSMKHEKK